MAKEKSATAKAANSEGGAKAKRAPSAYNTFMKSEIADISCMANKGAATGSSVYNPLSIDTPSTLTLSNGPQHTEENNVTPKAPVNTITGRDVVMENILILLAISVSAYIGCLIRIGFSMYRIWNIESNYCIMYAQVLGCLIMGFCVKHKTMFFEHCSHRVHRIVYVAITTGLCGSITSFSSYQMECNKSFFMQWDISSIDALGSVSGARSFEYITCLLSGIAVPLLGLFMGQHLASYSPYANHMYKDCNTSFGSQPLRWCGTFEVLIITSFGVSTLLTAILPITIPSPPDTHITVALLLATCGAYVRYLCSKLNNIYQHFPLGTLLCNVIGSWLLAAVTITAKLGVHSSNTPVLSLLYGIATGFCGCLTTVSTYVNELSNLPVTSAYRYAFWSTVLAQFGFIMILNIPAFVSVPVSSTVSVSQINMCTSYTSLCDAMLRYSNCPADAGISDSCVDGDSKDSITSFVGQCRCNDASLFSSSIRDALVLSQVRNNLSHNVLHLWPSAPLAVRNPLVSYDMCITYTRVCSDALNKLSCPTSQQRNVACGYMRHSSYIGECSCGDLKIGAILRDALIFHSLQVPLNEYIGYAMAPPIQFCDAAEKLCEHALDAMLCAAEDRTTGQCSEDGTYTGGCTCGGNRNIDIDNAIMSSLVSARTTHRLFSYLNFTSPASVDLCSSFENVCHGLFDSINCTARSVQACSGTTADTFVGACSCGGLDVGKQVGGVLASNLLQYDISQYTATAVSTGPYSLIIGGSHFAILNH